MPSSAVATPSAIGNIEARIAEIHSRMGTLKGQSGTSFADSLSAALGSTSGTADTSTFHATVQPFGGVSGEDVVAGAKKYLGVPYVYGGNDPATGLDCSSLVQQTFKQFGIELPRTAAEQARQGTKVNSLAEAKPGDLVAFGSPVDHIGIYAGNNKMVVAPRTGDVVKVQDVYATPVAIRRILPESSNFSVGGGLGALSSQYDSLFKAAGTKHGISPNILAAVAKAESNFNANAKSGAGALGLMQIMPGTAKGLGVNPMVPAEAVDGAAKMLSGLVKKYGSVDLALAAYNAGPGAVDKYKGIPPYTETQNYVKKVLSYVQGAK
jgi:cell wall-associated NlpC family hydrolase